MDIPEHTTTLPPPLAIDTKEASRLLSVSEKTLRDWRSKGGGPPFVRLHDGRCAPIRYLVEDLTAWLTARRCTSTAAYPSAPSSEPAEGE